VKNLDNKKMEETTNAYPFSIDIKYAQQKWRGYFLHSFSLHIFLYVSFTKLVSSCSLSLFERKSKLVPHYGTLHYFGLGACTAVALRRLTMDETKRREKISLKKF